MTPILPKDMLDTTATEIIQICNQAWQTGLMRGFSGNASIRFMPERIMITPSGVRKSRLTLNDFIIIDNTGAILFGEHRPSLEIGLHLALYSAFPACRALLHTHPVYLQALAGILTPERLLDLRLAESDYWRERLAHVAVYPPGSQGLAQATVSALQKRFSSSLLMPCAAWLNGHGLCALAEKLDTALGISEQLEQLAHIHWAKLTCCNV